MQWLTECDWFHETENSRQTCSNKYADEVLYHGSVDDLDQLSWKKGITSFHSVEFTFVFLSVLYIDMIVNILVFLTLTKTGRLAFFVVVKICQKQKQTKKVFFFVFFLTMSFEVRMKMITSLEFYTFVTMYCFLWPRPVFKDTEKQSSIGNNENKMMFLPFQISHLRIPSSYLIAMKVFRSLSGRESRQSQRGMSLVTSLSVLESSVIIAIFRETVNFSG